MIVFNVGLYKVTAREELPTSAGEPRVCIGTVDPNGNGVIAPLNYLQVMKLRDELTDWLGQNVNKGQRSWEGSLRG